MTRLGKLTKVVPLSSPIRNPAPITLERQAPVTDPFLLSLSLKLLSAAAVVFIAAFLVERTGPFVGAMIVTLPISTGPAYVFLAMEYSPAFLATSALSSLVANAATPIFMAVYALLAIKRGVVLSMGTALSVWAAIVTASLIVHWTLPLAVLLNVATYSTGALLMRRIANVAPGRVAERRWGDLLVRAAAVMGLCATVIIVARQIGPEAAGLVALAPMGFASMALVVHPRLGGATTAAVFANALLGMVGFAGALFVGHLTFEPLGSWGGLAAGLATSVAWNGIMVLVKLSRPRR